MTKAIPSHSAISKCGWYLKLVVSDLMSALNGEIAQQFKDDYEPKNSLLALIERNGRFDNQDWEQKLLLDEQGRTRFAEICGQRISNKFDSAKKISEVRHALEWLEAQPNFIKSALEFWPEPPKDKSRGAPIFEADWQRVVSLYIDGLAKQPEKAAAAGILCYLERGVLGPVTFTANCLLAYGAYLSGEGASSAKKVRYELDGMKKNAELFLNVISAKTFRGIGAIEMAWFTADLKKSVAKFHSLLGENDWEDFCSVSTRNDPHLSGRILCQQLCEVYFDLGKAPQKKDIYRLCGIDIVEPDIEEDTVKRVMKLAKARHSKLRDVEWRISGRHGVDILGQKKKD
ncbi:MAG: hypothetical protein IPM37_12690 [Hahellaceae bacterium]|nr:hypothetical protein [Hahellaceae bacterium]